MKRKLSAALLTIVLLCMCFCGSAFAAKKPSIEIITMQVNCQFAPVDLIIETSNESRSYILTTDLTSRTNYKPFCDEIEYFLKNRENDTFLAAIK